MKIFIITLTAGAKTITRKVIADATILALIQGLSLIELPEDPFTISCKPLRKTPCAI